MKVDSLTEFLSIEYADASLLRNSPQQSRSRQSLEKILRTCGEIIDESGHAGVTTAEVAKRADMAIGTVYRFFPDRIALLLGVYDFMISRYIEIALDTFAEHPAETWQEAFTTLVESTCTARRTIPGYKATHYRILPDGPNESKYQERTGAYIDAVVGLLSQYDDVPSGPEWRDKVGISIELSRTMQRVAFDADPHGDPTLIAEAASVPLQYLSTYIDEVS
ncbi:TetR/AcrR family transcriptional regulator [Paramicrobacterium agarici]|uniref:TetR family transcriptional regulator n=1 Tax=Paramicrobacterium agarici TaxID=630514 RepID=A0A2A9DZK2_9MICO|nr:TetR/AcrR family transcriptional regulator [Microbacterium agarici]PFG31350.1 TetR family transcriptional regulator [Microbacterium agarici]TQO21236.1 TetR family transcriptional regulator [Microbacterium agarici]